MAVVCSTKVNLPQLETSKYCPSQRQEGFWTLRPRLQLCVSHTDDGVLLRGFHLRPSLWRSASSRRKQRALHCNSCLCKKSGFPESQRGPLCDQYKIMQKSRLSLPLERCSSSRKALKIHSLNQIFFRMCFYSLLMKNIILPKKSVCVCVYIYIWQKENDYALLTWL